MGALELVTELVVGDEVQVGHQFRGKARGVVREVVDGGFRLELLTPCRTAYGVREVGDVVFYNWLRVRGVERVEGQ